MKKYKVKSQHTCQNMTLGANTIVYETAMTDFGLAEHETQARGEKYISISLMNNGSYPYYTIPLDNLEEIEGIRDED